MRSPNVRRLGPAYIAVAIALLAIRAPASSQPTLDDLVIRAFEITATVSPVPLRYEFTGGELRFNSRGTLRGRATAMVEVTAPDPVAVARFYFDSDMKLTSVKAPGHEVTFGRQRDALTVAFDPALPPGRKVAVTFDYEGQPLYIYDEFVMVSEGTLYPVLVSPFGDFSANLGRVSLALTAPGGFNIAATGKLVSRDGGTLQWDSEVAVPWVAIAGGRKHTIRNKTVAGLSMQFYVPPGEDRNLDKLADFTGRAVDFYSRLLYPFPYSELRSVSLLLGGVIGLDTRHSS